LLSDYLEKQVCTPLPLVGSAAYSAGLLPIIVTLTILVGLQLRHPNFNKCIKLKLLEQNLMNIILKIIFNEHHHNEYKYC